MTRAVLDADVIYPLPLRDTLLSIAERGGFQPAWSEAILDEAFGNLVADGRCTHQSARKTRTDMARAFDDAHTEVDPSLTAAMENHPKDRHVAACAVASGARFIVTGNIKDFQTLPPGVSALTPDAFLCQLLAADPDLVLRALNIQVGRLKRGKSTLDRLLHLLEPTAPNFVAGIRSQLT